jgi:hypothetical protein
MPALRLNPRVENGPLLNFLQSRPVETAPFYVHYKDNDYFSIADDPGTNAFRLNLV